MLRENRASSMRAEIITAGATHCLKLASSPNSHAHHIATRANCIPAAPACRANSAWSSRWRNCNPALRAGRSTSPRHSLTKQVLSRCRTLASERQSAKRLLRRPHRSPPNMSTMRSAHRMQPNRLRQRALTAIHQARHAALVNRTPPSAHASPGHASSDRTMHRSPP